eukprot:TRINITY_DN542_c0_g2_i7.p1 TRINITY_DN542_c0_g2~~TRINITY_DN542_c0_g2_i7.p1  ORF type:complete len:622 (+),score=138.04 TRINITY_DN542_c0_g2_i7:129-1994(+)
MCIRDRYQRRVRDTDIRGMAMEVEPVAVVLAFALPVLLWFQGSLDTWANRYLTLSSEDGMKATVHMQAIEKLNQEGRLAWVGVPAIAVVAFLTRQPGLAQDLVLLALAFIVAPLALLTSSTEASARFGWVTRIVQHAWLAARILIPLAAQPEVQVERIILFVALQFMWHEVSISSFSELLFNHCLTNLIVYSLINVSAPTCPLLSLFMISIFWYRRSRPLEDANELPQNLSGLTMKCAELVRVVLESGDELCQANVEALEQMLGLLTGKETAEKDGCQKVSPEGSVSESLTGQGCGTGTGEVQLSGDGWNMPEIWDVVESSSVLEDSPLTRPMSPLSEDDWILDSCKDDILPAADSVPETQHSPLDFPQKRPREELALDIPTYTIRPPSHSLPLSEQALPHSEQLVRMSFDAMAQLDPHTGTILWTNTAFEELTKMVGGGDQVLGLQCLHGRFLTQVTADLQCATELFGGVGCNPMEVWSASQLAGPAAQQVLLWVLHSSPVGSAGVSQSGSAGVSGSATAGYSTAAQCTDPQSRVLYNTGPTGGRGSRQAVLLWRRYGKKTITATSSADTTTMSGTIERVYYKCYRKSCAARLKIDSDPVTGEAVTIEPTGAHDHVVNML